MLCFDDLLLAKVLANDGAVPVSTLRAALLALGIRSESLAQFLELLGAHEDPLGITAEARDEYLRRQRDAICQAILSEQHLVSPEALSSVLEFQRRESFTDSLLAMLVKARHIKRGAIVAIAQQITERLREKQRWILSEYLKVDFAGLERPLYRAPSQTTESGSMVKTAGEEADFESSAMSLTVAPVEGHHDPEDRRIGLIVGGSYKLISKLGQGNMGMVYLAKHLVSSELFAVKLVRDTKSNREAIDRFRREILATSFFDHPNAVQIFDAAQLEDGTYYMVLEYVRGETLRDLIDREGPLDPARALRLAMQLLDGIAAAHSADIIHKDIKPENLMLVERGGREFLKIMDFGLARILDTDSFDEKIYQSVTGMISGSPAYIAPETLVEGFVDQRADLYSIGVTLFEFLTGVLPFPGKNVRDFVNGHLYKKPPLLGVSLPGKAFPASLDELIQKLLQKAPADRYSCCEEVRQVIKRSIMPLYESSMKETLEVPHDGKQG